MTLRDCLEQIRQLEKELVVFNVASPDPIDDQLSTYFATQNVSVSTAQTASRKPLTAILSDDTNVLRRIDIETLRELVDRSSSHSENVGISDAEYEAILGHLKETTFTSYDTEQMLYASREIEDRARRTGTGTIYAGFQQCSVMADQQAIYKDLARRGLDVHTYGVPDTTPPELGTAQVYAIDSDELAKMWFVVFDGGDEESQKSALLAEEQDENCFYGAWTYDATIVDGIIKYLESTYLSAVNSHTDSEL
jgi:DICT domain-containing protein